MRKISLILFALVSSALADQPGYAAPPAAPPQVKYGGPIVYTGEKPPIIHFPPPPEKTTSGDGYGSSGGKAAAIKYVPLPHHDLPVLIYTSDHQPPIHVVHTPRPDYQAQKKTYQEDFKLDQAEIQPKQDTVQPQQQQQQLRPSQPPKTYFKNPEFKAPGDGPEKQPPLPQQKNVGPQPKPQGFGAQIPSQQPNQNEKPADNSTRPEQSQQLPPPPPPPPQPRGPQKHNQAPPPKKHKYPHKLPSGFGLLSQKARQPSFGPNQRPEQKQDHPRSEQKQDQQRPEVQDYHNQRQEEQKHFENHQQGPEFPPQKLEKNFGPFQQKQDIRVGEPKLGSKVPPPPQKNFRGNPKPSHKPEKGFFHLPDFNLGGSSRKKDQEFSLFSRPEQKRPSGNFEPSQPIATTEEKVQEEKKEHSFFNLQELLAEFLPDPSYLKAGPKSEDVPQAPVKQTYSSDAPKGKPIFVKSPQAPTTVYLDPPNSALAVKESNNREDALPPPPPPPPAPLKKADPVTIDEYDLEDELKDAKEDVFVAPKVDEAQQKQSYDAPAPAYVPPKPQSYVPPKPTYKPKPTYQPRPKPVYNPPPTYAPAPPPAPHIIYAGHPPIHIYQQPNVETLAAAAPIAPPQTYNPPPQSYAAPKQSYQENAPAYNEPRQSLEKSDKVPESKAPLPPPPPPPPPAPKVSEKPPPVAPELPAAPQKVDQSAPKSDVVAPEDLIPAKDKNFNKEQKVYPPKQDQAQSSPRGNLGAPKGPGGFGAQKKQEYVPPKQHKRGPPPKPSSFGPQAKPAGFAAPKASPKSPPQPPPAAPQQPAQSKQAYQADPAPVYIPAPKAYHKPPIIIYQGVAPPVHVYEQPAGEGYNAQARSSNVEERSDSVVEPPAQPKVEEKAPVQPEEVVNIQGNDGDSEAVVSAKVSVVPDAEAKESVEKSKVTHKGTVEDIPDN